MSDKLHGFSRDDLECIADGLEAGYEKTVNVGQAIEPGFDVHVESTTAAAARFIRTALSAGSQNSAVDGCGVRGAGINGLTEAETSATASVMGLAPAGVAGTLTDEEKADCGLLSELDEGTPGVAAVPAVPAEVMAALERMSTPLHESWGSVARGATAAADARDMQTLRDFITRTADVQGLRGPNVNEPPTYPRPPAPPRNAGVAVGVRTDIAAAFLRLLEAYERLGDGGPNDRPAWVRDAEHAARAEVSAAGVAAVPPTKDRGVTPPEFQEVSWGVDSVMRECKGMAVSEYAFRRWAEENGITLAAGVQAVGGGQP